VALMVAAEAGLSQPCRLFRFDIEGFDLGGVEG